MPKIFVHTLFAAIFFIMAGCNCTSHSAKSATAVSDTAEQIIIDKNFSAEGRPDYSADTLFIINDILHIRLNYSGGCKEHSFQLFSTGMFTKSLPPQASVHLKHNNNGDNCRELVSKELLFNISALKHKSTKSIIINFDSSQKVAYEY